MNFKIDLQMMNQLAVTNYWFKNKMQDFNKMVGPIR